MALPHILSGANVEAQRKVYELSELAKFSLLSILLDELPMIRLKSLVYYSTERSAWCFVTT